MDSALPGDLTAHVMRREILLLLSLLSPIAEAFPNLYMSWWVPSNGRIKKYLKTWPRRVFAVLIVWIPILIVLAKVIESTSLVWVIAVLVFSAFGLRLYFFDRALKVELKSKGLTAKPSKLPVFGRATLLKER